MRARQGGQTHVDRLVAQAHRKAPVLRHAFFRNIQTRHELDALGQWRADAFVGMGLGLQHTIHPQTYLQIRFLRLDVHVRRASLRGVFKQTLQEAHHGCAIDPGAGREFAKVDRVAHVFFKGAGQA